MEQTLELRLLCGDMMMEICISSAFVVILGSVLLFEGPTLCCSASYAVRHADFLPEKFMVELF